MMKITFCNSSESAVLKVEGKLAGPWVDELERTWHSLNGTQISGHLQVDLCAVTYVDEEGKRLLQEMHKAGVDLVGDGIMTRYIIEKIKHDSNGHKSNGHNSHGQLRESRKHENTTRVGTH
jgi:hypothetical protein